jgi:hypothetical protein
MDLFAMTNIYAQEAKGNGHHAQPHYQQQRQQQAMMMMPNPQPPPEQEPSDEANASREEIQRKAKLPSEDFIAGAFAKLSNFSLAKLLPADLKDPMDKLPSEVRQEVDNINLQLESNVKKLFGTPQDPSRTEELSTMKSALLAVVARSNSNLNSDRSQQDKEKQARKLLQRLKPTIEKFYNGILQLMKALMAYNDHHDRQLMATSVQDNNPAAFIYRAWNEVLSYLQGIESVIVFAAKEQMIDLSNVANDFSALVKVDEERAMILREAIYEEEKQVLGLRGDLNEEKKKIKDVEEYYKGKRTELARSIRQSENLKAQLASLTHPALIAKKNIQDLTPATS